jgi:hypothetical protein
MSEVRKLFWLATDGIHRDSARGDAVAELSGDRAKIASPHEDQELKTTVSDAVGSEDAKACVARWWGRSFGHFNATVIKQGRVEGNRRRFSRHQIEEADGFFEHPARVKELDAEGVIRPRKEGFFRDEPNLPMVVVFKALIKRVQRGRRSFIGSAGQFLRQFLQAIKIKNLEVVRRGLKTWGETETGNDNAQRGGDFHSIGLPQNASCRKGVNRLRRVFTKTG